MSNYIKDTYSNLKEKSSGITTKTNFIDKHGNVLLEYGWYYYNNEDYNTLFYYDCDLDDSNLRSEEFENQLKSFFEKTYGKQVDHVKSYYIGWTRNDTAFGKDWTKERWDKMNKSQLKNSHNRHSDEFKNFLIDNNLLTESTNNMKLNKLQETRIIQSIIDGGFIIEIQKNNRLLFVTDKYELTWKKEYAWKFDTKESVENEIKNNRLLELTVGGNYKIINYKEAKNH